MPGLIRLLELSVDIVSIVVILFRLEIRVRSTEDQAVAENSYDTVSQSILLRVNIIDPIE